MVGTIERIFEDENIPALAEVLAEEGWSGELKDLIAWAWLGDLPNKPFDFRGKQITDVKRFYVRIGGAINEGPNGKRALSGELLSLLKDLKDISEDYEEFII